MGSRARRLVFVSLFLMLALQSVLAADLRITSPARDGSITWSNGFPTGVMTVETTPALGVPWTTRPTLYTSNSVGTAAIPLSASNTFMRLLAADISTNTPRHYTNLLEAYGILETVAGRGFFSTDVSHWSNVFEGEWATNVDLSRPHTAFGDPWGNVLIVDQRSSSVLKVTPSGRLYTYAGTHTAGDNGDGPAS